MIGLLQRTLGLAAAAVIATAATAAERIAVAEPRAGHGITEAEIAGISDYIESKLGGEYEIYSRSALNAILKEWELSNSGLMLDDAGRQELNQRAVSRLLVYTVSKPGSRYILTLMVVNPETGKIDSDHRASVEAPTFDQLIGRIDHALARAGLLAGAEARKIKRLALLPTEMAACAAPQIGGKFNSLLGSWLLKSGSFELLSREDLAKIAAESGLAESVLADSGQRAGVGRLQLGDYIIISKITRYQRRAAATATTIAGTSAARILIDLELQVRILEVATGQIIASEDLTFSLNSRDIPAASRRDWTVADYDDDILKTAAAHTGATLLERLDPLRIAAVDGKTVYLTRGEGAGITPGATYQVFAPGKTFRHPVTGKVIGTTETEVATIRVNRIMPGTAAAEIVKSSGEIPVGAICRGSAPAAAPKTEPALPPPAYPAAT